MPLEYNKKLIPAAKELRRNATRQEKRLWYDFLSAYPIRFQRQKTIGNFIVDFYCHKAKLIIEIDGNQHYTEDGLAYDKERCDLLKGFDLQILRFKNLDIDEHFHVVCDVINEAIKGSLREGAVTK